MEQNKVLMIIVSVAIFFAAIVGVGVALLYPRSEPETQVASTGDTRDFDPIEYVRRPDPARLEETPEEEPAIIVYGERVEPTEEGGLEDDVIGGEDGERTITIEPARRAPAEEDAREDERVSARSETGDRSTAAETAPPESADVAPVSPSRGVDSAEVTATRPQPRQIRVTEYWIQLIASPNRDRVDYAQEILTDYSLGGRVTTRDVDGEIYYRLRVGPYDNHDEAEKFLRWIRDIDGFTEAYISEEYPLRTVNG